MLKKGYVAWIAGVLVGVMTSLAIERAFRFRDPNEILPLSQAAGLWLAWLVAWPYMRTRPRWSWVPEGFTYYAASMFVICTAIASLRIAFRTG